MVFWAGMLCALSAWAVDPSTNLQTYYAAANGKATDANDALRVQLCTIISTNYSSIGYSSLSTSVYAASSNPSDFYNGSSMTMEDIYSSKEYTSSQDGSSANTCGTGWNKEHTVPQSWFGEASPMKSDAHHVFPTDIRMNSCRSNYPYGENDAAKYCNSYGYGHLGTSTFAGYSGTVFDPGSKEDCGGKCYRGDLARVYFYMVTRYRTTNFTSGTGSTSFTYSNGVADLTDYMKNLMLKWHREDPVSEKELIRNNAIYAHQHNRNPFVDYPCLAEYIWGEHKGEAVDLNALVSGYAGVGTDCCSGGGGGGGGVDPTPPPTPEEYTIAWSIKGETNSDKVKEGEQPTPPSVADCSTSRVFMGWTTSSSVEAKPAILYADDEIPLAEAAVTYYAVFADKSTGGSGTKETTFAAKDFSGQGTGGTGSPISVTKDGITIACDKGYGSDPIRCYKNGVITITSSTPIKALAFDLHASYPGGLNTSYTDLNTTEWSFTLTSQARISSVTVTTSGATTYSNYGLQCEETPECKATITILSADENQGTVEFIDD